MSVVTNGVPAPVIVITHAIIVKLTPFTQSTYFAVAGDVGFTIMYLICSSVGVKLSPDVVIVELLVNTTLKCVGDLYCTLGRSKEDNDCSLCIFVYSIKLSVETNAAQVKVNVDHAILMAISSLV